MATAWRRSAPKHEAPAFEIVSQSDEDLVCRVAERDHLAFEALHQRYARPMFALALRQLRDPHRAEDAVQDAFTAIWRSASTYRPDRGRAAPWLFRIVRNIVIDICRRDRRTHDVRELPEMADESPAPQESVERAWSSFQVHAAVVGLPERERVLIELAYWQGRSQSEIARALRLPLGTVKTRTLRALAHLAAQLEGTL